MFPITTGKLEISGKTELKVNGAGAVVHLFHFYTLWIPIGKCLLIARYIHVALHIFALQFYMYRIGILAHVLLKD